MFRPRKQLWRNWTSGEAALALIGSVGVTQVSHGAICADMEASPRRGQPCG